MTITMQQALKFNDLYSTIKNSFCPVQTAYKLSVIHSETSKQIEFYKTQMQQIIKLYARLSPDGIPLRSTDGKQILIKEGEEENCAREIKALEDFQVDIKDVYFGFNELEQLELNLDAVETLSPFIKNE